MKIKKIMLNEKKGGTRSAPPLAQRCKMWMGAMNSPKTPAKLKAAAEKTYNAKCSKGM